MGWLPVSGAGVTVSAQMSKSSSQTLVSNNTEQLVTWNREDWDDDGDLVDLANDKFVIQETGNYLIAVVWMNDTTAPGTDAYAVLKIDGSDAIPIHRIEENTLTNSTYDFTRVWPLTAGEELTLYVNPRSTAMALRGNASTHISSTFSVTRLP